jgi:hypothetical protein
MALLSKGLTVVLIALSSLTIVATLYNTIHLNNFDIIHTQEGSEE